MDVSVIVAASTTSTRDTAEYPTIGGLAQAVALECDTSGGMFTLKVNGQTASRDAATQDLTADDVLELIEIPAGEAQPDQPTPDPSLVDSSVPPPATDAEPSA